MSSDRPGAIRVRLLRGSYYGFLATSVSMVGNLTISVVLARLLGSAGLGIYTIYTVLGTVFIPLASFSIPNAVTKYTAELRHKDLDRLSRLLSTSLLVLLSAGIVGGAIMFFAIAPAAGSLYRAGELHGMLGILALTLTANMIGLFAGGVLQGLEEFQVASLLGALSVGTNIPVLLWLLPISGPLGAAVAGAVSALIYAIAAAVSARRAMGRHGIRWVWELTWADARTVFYYAVPLNAASLLARASALIQNSLVAIYLGFADLGLLRVAGVFNNALLVLPRTILAPMLPVLSSVAATRTRERSREILTQLVRMGLLMSGTLAGALILAVPFATRLLFGAEYIPAVPLAIVLVQAAALVFLNAVIGEQYLLATGRTMKALYVTAYSVTTSLILVVFLLPRLGTIALPLSGLVTELTLFILLIAWLAQREELAFDRLVPAIGYALVSISGPVAASLFLTPEWGLVAAFLVPGALAALAYRFLMGPEDRGLLRDALRRGRLALTGRTN